MAGNARCQIWGPTAGKHHQKSVIWVTVFEDMNKFAKGRIIRKLMGGGGGAKYKKNIRAREN